MVHHAQAEPCASRVGPSSTHLALDNSLAGTLHATRRLIDSYFPSACAQEDEDEVGTSFGVVVSQERIPLWHRSCSHTNTAVASEQSAPSSRTPVTVRFVHCCYLIKTIYECSEREGGCWHCRAEQARKVGGSGGQGQEHLLCPPPSPSLPPLG